MKILKYITALVLPAALAACGEKSEVFYTTSYPVIRIEAVVTLAETAPAPTAEEPGNSAPEDPNPGEPEDPVIQQIRDKVTAEAPVQAGGSYKLYFSLHNGGRLQVWPNADADPVAGAFLKEPDKQDQLRFLYGDQAYTCTATYYLEEGDISRIVLVTDLTEQYRELYPAADITQVARREYTSLPY